MAIIKLFGLQKIISWQPLKDAKEREEALKEFFLQNEIHLVTKEQELFRDNLGRMDENDEIEENQDQKEVRKILRASV